MMPLLASSQTLSTEDLVTVPIKTLKNALIVKTERDFLKNQIGVTRDSVNILTNVVVNQDSVIKTQDSSISLYKKNESNYTSIINKKDGIIDIWYLKNKETGKYDRAFVDLKRRGLIDGLLVDANGKGKWTHLYLDEEKVGYWTHVVIFDGNGKTEYVGTLNRNGTINSLEKVS